MAKRRILALILIVAAIITIAVVFVTVFSVSNVLFVFYDESGNQLSSPDDSPVSNDILDEFGYQNIMFLSKSKVLQYLNATYTDFHAISVVKSFPNTLTVHMVSRVAVFSLNFSNQTIFVDSFGFVMDVASAGTVDITSIFDSGSPKTATKGSKLEFNTQSDNLRLDIVLDAVGAIWQLKYAFSDISNIVQSFSFNQTNSILTIVTPNGTKIEVHSPHDNIAPRLIKGFGVYYNDYIDVQQPNVTITISAAGNVQTTQD